VSNPSLTTSFYPAGGAFPDLSVFAWTPLERYGAVGDGRNDADAIEAAILSGEKYLRGSPGKNYTINRPINIYGRTDVIIDMTGSGITQGPLADGGIRWNSCTNCFILAEGVGGGEWIGNIDTAGAWVSHVTTTGVTSGSSQGTAAANVAAGINVVPIAGLGVGYLKKGDRFQYIVSGTTYSHIIQSDAAITAGAATVTLDRNLVAPITAGQPIYTNMWGRRMVVAVAAGPSDTTITLECADVTSADGSPRILAGDQFCFHSNYNDIDQIDYTKVCEVAVSGPSIAYPMTGAYPAMTVTVPLTAPLGRSIPLGTMITSLSDHRNNRFSPVLFFGCTNCGVIGMRLSKSRLHGFVANATVRSPWEGVDPSTMPNVGIVFANNVDNSAYSPGSSTVFAWAERSETINPRGTYNLGALRNLVTIERSKQILVSNPSMYGGQYCVTINGECESILIDNMRATFAMRTFRQANTSKDVTITGGHVLTHATYSDYGAIIYANAIDDDGMLAVGSGARNDTKIIGLRCNGPTRTSGTMLGAGAHFIVIPQGTTAPVGVKLKDVSSVGASGNGIYFNSGQGCEVVNADVRKSGLAGFRGVGGAKNIVHKLSVIDAGQITPSAGAILDGGTDWSLCGLRTGIETGTGMASGLSVINGATIEEWQDNKIAGTGSSGGASSISFELRADAVLACSYGWRAKNGKIVLVGGVPMIGVTGSTVIADLPGLEYFVLGSTEAAAMRALIAAFGRPELIGTVSQASGVPTGAVFERNANGQGRIQKDANFAMRVSRDDFLVAGITTADGGSYRSADVTWTFPQAFAAPPVPEIVALDPQCRAQIVSRSKTAVTFRVVSSVAKNFCAVSCAAIGRWYVPGVGGWADLFAGGQKGAVYQFWNPETLYTDTGRTALITGVGNQIAGVADLSGNGVHLAQSTPTRRPLYSLGSDGRGGATLDGLDDNWASVVPLPAMASGQVTVIAGFRKATDVNGFLAELGPTAYSTPGSWALISAPGGATTVQFYSRGSSNAGGGTVTGLGAPLTCVAVARGDTAASLAALRVNKGTEAAATTAQGGGGYGAATLNVGTRNGSAGAFQGLLTDLIIREGLLTATQTETIVDDIYARAGA